MKYHNFVFAWIDKKNEAYLIQRQEIVDDILHVTLKTEGRKNDEGNTKIEPL